MIVDSEQGLLCPEGRFHLDPLLPVERAVITHAHGDHARAGSASYLCSEDCAALIRRRVGPEARIETLAYGERRRIGEVTVSLHPAGHMLGSAQVRIEGRDGVWVLSGDYKREPDPTCAPFEAARRTDRPVWVHGAVESFAEIYRARGVKRAQTRHVAEENGLLGELVLAPLTARGTPWMKRFRAFETAFASGLLRIRGTRSRRGFDRGFVISDHADWPGLLATIRETGASRVLAVHGYREALVRWLLESGLDAAPIGAAHTPLDPEGD